MQNRLPGPVMAVAAAAINLLVLVACANPSESLGEAASASNRSPALRLQVKVLDKYPHDRTAFTQGLVWFDGKLFESTGLQGQSSLRRVTLESGAIEQNIDLPSHLFGEGLARVDDRLFQLTYQSGILRVYDLETLQLINQFSYAGEGWGICFDERYLFVSDGSATLAVRDPHNFDAIRKIEVRLDGRPVEGLNELECAEGWIYANVYRTDTIVRVDPATGSVRATIDASKLLSPQQRQHSGVLNGIAFNRRSGTFLLTGKNWPSIFEVVLTEASPQG